MDKSKGHEVGMDKCLSHMKTLILYLFKIILNAKYKLRERQNNKFFFLKIKIKKIVKG